MTRDISRPPESVRPEAARDDDLLASLWEEAPFARLPPDAPKELEYLVQDIENPKRVYAIHRASRRHNFQLLVERYIIQLRQGCGSESCVTATCLTCRKRLAGKTPIRRYSTTSARILAVYLASQDSPENGLCPYIKPSREAPAALSSLIFSSQRPNQSLNDPLARKHPQPPRRNSDTQRSTPAHTSPPRHGDSNTIADASGRAQKPRRKSSASRERSHVSSESVVAQPSFKVTERPVSKDHRSFAANVFGSVAFKMLEWLTPTGLATMSEKVASLDQMQSGETQASQGRKPESQMTPESSDQLEGDSSDDVPGETLSKGTRDGRGDSLQGTTEVADEQSTLERDSSSTTTAPPTPGSDMPRRKSSARVRANSSAAPKRTVSVEQVQQGPFSEDAAAPTITSPQLGGVITDKMPRPPKTSTVKSRTISDVAPTPSVADNVSPASETPCLETEAETEVQSGDSEMDSDRAQRSGFVPSLSQQGSKLGASVLGRQLPANDAILDGLLPQSVRTLSMGLVDLFCDVLQNDGTSERHLFEPPIINSSDFWSKTYPKPTQRNDQPQQSYPTPLKRQWQLFIQQSLFNTLSDPHRLIKSFTDDELLDSHAMWYCMLRLTRVAPSLVFDSLWIASASLFGAPKSLQSLRSPTTKVFRRPARSLSNLEAGQIIYICLHALVAAAPLVKSRRALAEMSKIRSYGLTFPPSDGLPLSGNGSLARPTASLCLQYNDAFSDDLALRLARRLFSAISARQCFAEMAALDESSEKPESWEDPLKSDFGGLQTLLLQLDLIGFSGIPTDPRLEFSASERAVHESRAPTLILDWARTVMLQEWDGEPEVSCSGPFGGALALMTAMYEKRQSLLLKDGQFRVDYFADRLDSVSMPVAWLSHVSAKQKKHLLDFPYLFNQSTRISYFRSINCLRMSRGYEESSSLRARMEAIVTPGGLVTNPHHRIVLQDLLRTASSKYLILQISRKNVVRDAFDQLWRREERELLRPLKVHLGKDGGEIGMDSGGVQQEFFRLAIAECLNPDFGAFTVDDRTRMAWFVPGSIVPDWKFEIFGVILSLAVYNGVTLPVTFPKALYRKLLGLPVDQLHHIADGWPDLASGLTTLLEWNEADGQVEDIFARTYEFSVEMFDQPISREMKPGEDADWPQLAKPAPSNSSPEDSAGDEGADTEVPLLLGNPDDAPLVTNLTRNAYVTDYIRYLTDISVRPQFEAFARGFNACLHPRSLSLLSPGILQSVVEGQQEIDISELRRYARYVGWDASHRSVRDFWSVVKRFDEGMKKRLLEFVTASDRIPVGGMRNLLFVVQKNGEEEGEDGHLPTAYTCYGTLLLPEYRDKEVLRDRLRTALENAQGFGFA